MTDPEKIPDKPCFTERMLLQLARDARGAAYAPYSGFTVGAACTAESGVSYFGCNVENASYPAGICAERVAVAVAIAHGERKIKSIAIAGGPSGSAPDGSIRPCGMCLQFLSEFMDPDGTILIADGTDREIRLTLKELIPHAFKLKPEPRPAAAGSGHNQ
jgi:cytidine deaminase